MQTNGSRSEWLFWIRQNYSDLKGSGSAILICSENIILCIQCYCIKIIIIIAFISLVVYAEDGGAGYDMMVKNCFAYDSTNFKTANKIQ